MAAGLFCLEVVCALSVEIYVYLWTNASGVSVLTVTYSWERKNITPAAEDKA